MDGLKAELDRLRSEHTHAHQLYQQALRDGQCTVEWYAWLFRLAEDLFREMRHVEAQLAQQMEAGR